MSWKVWGIRWVAGGLGLALALGGPQVGAGARQPPLPPPKRVGPAMYQNPIYTPAERAADLVARMTLAEKASQMIAGVTPAIPSLHISAYGWWNEALHGVADMQRAPSATCPGQPTPSGCTTTLDNTTSYPDDLAVGSSWDPSVAYREASAISDEARELVPKQSLDLSFFTPTVNLSRDPRWGRNDETFSEDPLLTADMASQYVDGFEGKTPTGGLLPQGGGYLKALATVKHYAAYNSEVNRMTGSSNIDERTLREYYTAQFRQIITQSQPAAIMSAYNEVNGTPSAADVHLIQTLARQTYGLDGYFTSDCDALDDITNPLGHRWRPAGYNRPLNPAEGHAFANAAGEDLNCNEFFIPLDNQNLLPAASGEGIQTPTDTYNVNDMDASLVRLFAARIETGEFGNVNSEPWVRRARAQLGAVQWANNDSNNAVTETPARLALAQDIADRSEVLLKNNATKQKNGTVGPLLPIHVPTSGPFKVAVIGHLANRTELWTGDYSSNQGTPGVAKEVTPYEGIKAAIQAINPSAQVDFYQGFTNPGGAPCTAPACDGADTLTNIDPAAVAAAAGYDYVIVDVGTDWSTADEQIDRKSLNLPGVQAQLVQEVAAQNPNTVALMQSGGEVNTSSWQSSVPAIVWSAFNGEREGAAQADVLLGKYDPSGHLPFTWYQGDSELPSITDYRIRPGKGTPGRTYMYFRGGVSYPFGYGLSYTTFKDSELRVSHTRLTADDTLKVSVNVTNTGAYPGEDLVQLYVTTPGAQGAPSKRLEGFKQVYLTPGQTRTATFEVKVGSLAFWAGHEFAVHDGLYGIQIAGSAASQDVLLSRFVHVRGTLTPAPSVVTASPQMSGDAARGIQQRVLFPEGATVEPHLTVAMNNSLLYGYIHQGGSRRLPAGVRISYTSDNPAAVAVVGDKVRTMSTGIATITTTVTYNHVSASGQFVVRVLSELNGIALNLRPHKASRHHKKKHLPAPIPLAGFEPDTYGYEVIVPAGQPTPRIIPAAPDRQAHVRTTQATGVPGTAQATITGPDDIPLTYTVYFARPATNFAGQVGPQWSWINPNPAADQIAGGSVRITPEPGSLVSGSARNLLVEPALGDWTINTRLTFSTPPNAAGQQAGLVAYQDDGDYLTLDWEYDTSGGAQLVETTTDSLSGAPVSQVLATVPTAGRLGHTVWLRMVKQGPRFSTLYSADGVHFVPIYSAGANLSDLKVGVFALGSGPAASFGYFHVRPAIPAALH